MYKATMLVCAAAVAAVPTILSSQATCSTGFIAHMTTSGGELSLDAVANGTNANLVVIGQPPPVPGGKVMLTGSSPKASLSFSINGEKYGWVVGDIAGFLTLKQLSCGKLTTYKGHVSGIAIGVGAEKAYEEFGFTITDDGSVYHRLTAATNMWLACNRTVNGEQHTILAWGNMASGGGFPEGCSFTRVKQICIDNIAPIYDG